MKKDIRVATCGEKSIYDSQTDGKSFVDISRETPRFDPRVEPKGPQNYRPGQPEDTGCAHNSRPPARHS